MSFKVNDNERHALRGCQHLQQLVYLLGLRPYMDFTTGVVGRVRRVSYGSIAQVLEVDRHRGYRGGRPSEYRIKRALVGLAKKGLIVAHKNPTSLIFDCCLADRGFCVQNKAAPKPPPLVAPPKTAAALADLGDARQRGGKAASLKTAQAAPYLVTGKKMTLSQQTARKSIICEQFQPAPWVLETARQRGCQPTSGEAERDERLHFIYYHRSRGHLRVDWNAEYLRWLLRGKHYQQEKQRHAQQTAHGPATIARQQRAVTAVLEANRVLLAPTEKGGRQ